jgi:hypothetical protein
LTNHLTFALTRLPSASPQVEVEAWYYSGRHDPRLLYSDGTHLSAAAYLYLGYEPDAPIDDFGSGSFEEASLLSWT